MKMIDEKLILDAAADEFAELGFSGARVDSIARRAGINKAMLYYRVGDKEELYRRIVLRGQATIKSTIMDALSTSKTAVDMISDILGGITENASENRLMPSIILREIAGNAENIPETGRDGIKNFMDTIRSVVSMGVEDGTFRDIDPVALHFMVLGAVFTLSLTGDLRLNISSENPGPLTSEQITESIKDILMHGILRKGTG